MPCPGCGEEFGPDAWTGIFSGRRWHLRCHQDAYYREGKTMNLEEGDKLAASVAVAPRVTLDDIKAAISTIVYTTGGDAFANDIHRLTDGEIRQLSIFTICMVIMKNGFIVLGKSAPASSENFNAEVGKTFARDDAMRQIWPLMGYALKDRLWRDKEGDEEFKAATSRSVPRY
jgi:hypothetical protein